jgi:hypothetical protein
MYLCVDTLFACSANQGRLDKFERVLCRRLIPPGREKKTTKLNRCVA